MHPNPQAEMIMLHSKCSCCYNGFAQTNATMTEIDIRSDHERVSDRSGNGNAPSHLLLTGEVHAR